MRNQREICSTVCRLKKEKINYQDQFLKWVLQISHHKVLVAIDDLYLTNEGWNFAVMENPLLDDGKRGNQELSSRRMKWYSY